MTERKKSAPFYQLVDEIKTLHDAKGEAYEGTSEVYANYRRMDKWVKALVANPDLAPTIYALMRNEEKMERIRNVLEGTEPGQESIEDTLKDIAIIPLIALILYRERYSKLNKMERDERICSIQYPHQDALFHTWGDEKCIYCHVKMLEHSPLSK